MKIIPAILETEVKELENKLNLASTFSNYVHIDIADGNFVPIKTVSIENLVHCKNKGKCRVIIHLMAFTPNKHFDDIKELKAEKVIFHFESTKDLGNVIKKAKNYKFETGLALSPETTVDQIKKYVKFFDEILVMSVIPGASGRLFMSSELRKLKQLRRLFPRKILSIDGGVNETNIKEIKKAGADIAYAASAIWKHSNVKKTYAELKKYA